MKIRHRIPPEAHFVSDPIAPDYQAEVDRTMAKAATRQGVAERRLEAAERRLERAGRIKAKAQRERATNGARELVEARRQELLAVQRAMTETGRPSKHRPVPDMHTL